MIRFIKWLWHKIDVFLVGYETEEYTSKTVMDKNNSVAGGYLHRKFFEAIGKAKPLTEFMNDQSTKPDIAKEIKQYIDSRVELAADQSLPPNNHPNPDNPFVAPLSQLTQLGFERFKECKRAQQQMTTPHDCGNGYETVWARIIRKKG